MPKKHRLSRADFARISRSGSRRVHGEYFSLTATALPKGASAKVACVVSKKIARRAVDRNNIERKAREALRPLMAHTAQPRALVFHAKREALAASYSEIGGDIKKLISRMS